ncbi:MAG: cation diffusion facilitator family transporter [Alphaproteobacteria bacterium]
MAGSAKPSTLTAEAAGALMRRATTAALGVAITLCLAKAVVWLMTDSVALLGSLLDSLLDIVATGLNFVAVRHALVPADREHRFGHGKAEALSGLAQGAFIAGSALFLFVQSAGRLFHPPTVDFAIAGIGVTVFSLAMTIALVTFQRVVKAQTGSIAIAADELHYRSDLILNAGVLLAFALSGIVANVPLADPAIGATIAVYIGWSAYRIVRQSYDHLMDRELADVERDRIKAIVRANPNVVSMHDLRTRRSGRHVFVQLHLELAPAMPLVEAHRISDEVERAILAEFPEAEVLIHEDPAGQEAPQAARFA